MSQNGHMYFPRSSGRHRAMILTKELLEVNP
jgi:hypothetical protein